ncbi:MAG: glycoside hydrolase family 16 protein [Lentisphaerae bacterium]|nr:glycoside hydrolase family 16 protein [Lentisphaerota bacterium]
MRTHLFIALLLIGLTLGCETETGPLLDGNHVGPETVCPSANNRPRGISFAGRSWEIRQSTSPSQAGANCFANDQRNVWVDSQDRLHLKITNRGGVWTCAEVFSTDGYGYGTYTFRVVSAAGALNRNVVFGLFTWDDDAPAMGKIHEIDIEITPWSRAWGENLHYAVQPVMGPDTSNGQYDERSSSTFLPPDATASVHHFTWMPSFVDFASYIGLSATGVPLHAWRFADSNPARRSNETTLPTPVGIPTPSQHTSVRLNLWLFDDDGNGYGDAPSDEAEPEVVIDQFTFTPAS